MAEQTFSRRGLILTAGAALFTPALLRAQTPVPEIAAPVRHNTNGFSSQNWQDHFDTLGKAAIVADTSSRALHYWGGDGETYKIYPTSVPRSDELTKRGYTRIVRKRVGPDWTPTPSIIERDPDPKYTPPGPDHPPLARTPRDDKTTCEPVPHSDQLVFLILHHTYATYDGSIGLQLTQVELRKLCAKVSEAIF